MKSIPRYSILKKQEYRVVIIERHLVFYKINEEDKYPKFLRQLIFKLRRQIETTASQLTEQLSIEKVLAKSLWGLQARIKTKLLANILLSSTMS